MIESEGIARLLLLQPALFSFTVYNSMRLSLDEGAMTRNELFLLWTGAYHCCFEFSAAFDSADACYGRASNLVLTATLLLHEPILEMKV